MMGTDPEHILRETRIPTTSPGETLPKVIAFFEPAADQLEAVGIGSFGPLDLDPVSSSYGCITETTKTGWAGTDILGPIQSIFGLPIGFDTDVNAAALGEQRWGAAQGLDTFLYLTIGTGIGGGALVEGNLLHGLMHPEMGHIPIPHDRNQDPFQGICAYHHDCFEGLASGPALEARWGARAETFSEDHPAWALEAQYVAYAVVNYISILAPQRVILGGGVMQQKHLFPLIRSEVLQILNGYMQIPDIIGDLDHYIVSPALGNQAGILGSIALARKTIGH
jgi:fructokinase